MRIETPSGGVAAGSTISPAGINYVNASVPESLVINAVSGASGVTVTTSWTMSPAIATGYTAAGGWEITKDGVAFYGPSGEPLLGFYPARGPRIIPLIESTTTHALILTDENSIIKATNASGCAFSIANTSTVNYPIGWSTILSRATGAGAISVSLAGGVTMTNSAQLALVQEQQSIGIYHESANVWRCI